MAVYMNYIFYVTVIYMVVNLPSICGEIGVNCGSGAVVGEPYNLECTNIPDTPTNGINVFLGDETTSIIPCFTSKTCASRNTLYNVTSPHTDILKFTILNVREDDIGKKLYCVDDTALDPSSPSCTLTKSVPQTTTNTVSITDNQNNPGVPQSTTITTSISDNQNNPEIGVNCGSGAVVGEPYNLECTNIPDPPTSGIKVFLGDETNSIIICVIGPPTDCVSRNPALYNVTSPHTDILKFTILNVREDDIGKKLYCVDGTAQNPSSPSCTIMNNGGGLSDGEVAVIVVVVVVFVVVCIIIVIVAWKKKCCCFFSKKL